MTIKKTETKKTAPARKVRATKKPAPIAATVLTEKEKADKFVQAKKANGLTLFAHMGKGMKAVGYGREIFGANMGALTCAVFAELGYIKVSATGNVTATGKQIERANITALLGSSMTNRWYNTHTRIVAGKLNAKGLNMLNARNAGESISKSGEGTICATKAELVKLYRAWVKNGKGSKTVPFSAYKVQGLTK